MEAISGKTAHVSFLGFIFGAGFTLFKWTDDSLYHRKHNFPLENNNGIYPASRNKLPPASAHVSFAGALRLAGAEGARTAIAVGAGTAIALSISLARNGRRHPAMASAAGDSVGAGVATFTVGLFLLDHIPVRARLVPSAGAGALVALLVSGIRPGEE
jgi:hypothetical protein